MDDGWEIAFNLNPLDPTDALDDPDGDELTNLEEYENNTNPLIADSDGDGYSDKEEVDAGTEPNAPEDYPSASTFTARQSGAIVNYTLTGLLTLFLFRRKKRTKNH